MKSEKPEKRSTYQRLEKQMQSEKQYSKTGLLFIGFLIIYSALLIYTSFKINLSEDEIYTLNTTSRPLPGVIHQSYFFEYQPPFYFLVFSWWRLISPGIFFAKLFSIICIGFSACFFYKLVLQLSSRSVAKWMVVIFLLNPFTVWAALEIRLYAFLILLSIAAGYNFFRYYFENKKRYLLIFSIISLAGIYTQYFYSFLIAAFGFIILILGKRQHFFTYLLFLTPVALLSLPNLLFIGTGVANQQAKVENFPFSVFHRILYTPRSYLLSIDDVHGMWPRRIVRIIIYLSILIAYLKFFIKKKEPGANSILRNYHWILLSIIIMIALYCSAFYVAKALYEPKYLAAVFPLIIFIYSIYNAYTPIIRNALYSSISVYFILILFSQYRHPVKTYDYRSVANFIESNEKPNTPVFIYRPILATPLNLYYHGENKIIPVPYPVNYDSNYRFNISDTNELRNSILPKLKDSRSFYFISDTTKYEGFVRMNREMISDYLSNRYKKSLDTFLLGYGKGRCLRIQKFEERNPTE